MATGKDKESEFTFVNIALGSENMDPVKKRADIRKSTFLTNRSSLTRRRIATSYSLEHACAFTLVELLIVIAIIALLASLLLPVLSVGRYSARQAACKSNLRQMGIALTLYGDTHENYVPLFVPHPGRVGATMNGLFALNGVEMVKVAFCPLGVGFILPDKSRRPYSLSYSYNSDGVVGMHSSVIVNAGLGLGNAKVSSVLFPSEMVAVGDAANRSTHPNREVYLNDLDLHPIPANFNGIVPQPDALPDKEQPAFKIHRARFNRVYVDGHVAVEDFRKPFSDSDEYLRKFNIDHEPHRDVWLKSGR